MATISTTTILTVTTVVPSTLATYLAPTTPPTTTLPVTTESTTVDTSTEKTIQLVKAMEEMSIQAIELKRLREKVASLETP